MFSPCVLLAVRSILSPLIGSMVTLKFIFLFDVIINGIFNESSKNHLFMIAFAAKFSSCQPKTNGQPGASNWLSIPNNFVDSVYPSFKLEPSVWVYEAEIFFTDISNKAVFSAINTSGLSLFSNLPTTITCAPLIVVSVFILILFFDTTSQSPLISLPVLSVILTLVISSVFKLCVILFVLFVLKLMSFSW